MMHAFYVFTYYLIYNIGLLVVADGEIKVKKGRKIALYSIMLAILTVPVILFLILDTFHTGAEATPIWFYLFHILCIIPIIFFAERNFFVNWLVTFVVSNLWYLVSSACIACIMAPFLPPAIIIKSCSSMSDWIHFAAFAISSIVGTILSRLFFYFVLKISKKRWVFILLSLAFLIPAFATLIFSEFINSHRISISFTSILLNIFIFPLLMLTCYLIYRFNIIRQKKQLLKQIEQEINDCSNEYEKIVSFLKESRHVRHDLKNNLAILEQYSSSLSSNDEALTKLINQSSKIQNQTNSLNIKHYCDNVVINVLLSIKYNQAVEKDITPSFVIDIPNEIPFNIYDIVGVLSNLLDNSIEATEKVDKTLRQITLHIHAENGYFCIESANPFLAELNPLERDYATTKEDSSNHGIGTEIINDIIKTYDGYSKAEITDNLYNVLIALKLPE